MEDKNKKRLFCEISPFTYQLSLLKERLKRNAGDLFLLSKFAKEKGKEPLPVLIYEHKSLMRRRLGNVRQDLQENKVVNLSLAAPKVSEGIGGGMCQFTNLIHWLILHSPLDIVEHHHHDGFDLFPDFGRKVPFGTGTSIFYKHLDYRFRNNTDQAFQLIVAAGEEYLSGALRAEKELPVKFHIFVKDEKFVREGSEIYRTGTVMRICNDKKTGNILSETVLKQNHAKVMYEMPFEMAESGDCP